MRRLLPLVLGLTPTLGLALDYQHIARPGELVLRAEVNVGTLDACGQREAPHLIEHLLLSETMYGSTPADMLLALNRQGIKLKALTAQDYTSYTLSGPASAGAEMERAMAAILARRELPAAAIPREIDAILLELGQVAGYRSAPHEFEHYAARTVGSPAPCPPDEVPLEKIPHAGTNAVYDQFYVPANMRLTAVGPSSGMDLARLARQIEESRPNGEPFQRARVQLPKEPFVGNIPELPDQGSGEIELLMAIPGRTTMPAYVARDLAERLRLEAQAVMRRTPVTYTVRAVVHQSASAGWISLQAKVERADVRSMVYKTVSAVKESLGRYGFNGSPDMIALMSNQELAESQNVVHPQMVASGVEESARLALATLEVSFSPDRAQSEGIKGRVVVVAQAGLVGLLACFAIYHACLSRNRKLKPLKVDIKKT